MPTTTIQGEAMAPEFRTCQNNTVTDITAYSVVKRVPAEAPDGVDVTAADTDIPAGVVPKKVDKSGGVGDMAIRGRVRVIASGAITADARIAPAAAGKVQAAAAADIVMGRALEAAVNDGDIIMAEIDCVAPTLF